MKIAIGSDHAGFELKESLKEFLEKQGHEYSDMGAKTIDPGDDYPIFARKVGEAVASGEYDRGIVVCGTGIGVSISANKVPGIRAAACYTINMAEISRVHNNANVLALGGRITAKQLGRDITKAWLEKSFANGERHNRRISQIDRIEER